MGSDGEVYDNSNIFPDYHGVLEHSRRNQRKGVSTPDSSLRKLTSSSALSEPASTGTASEALSAALPRAAIRDLGKPRCCKQVSATR